MKKTTVVTSLYDIGRNKIDGRTWDQYLEWFSETLKIKRDDPIETEEKVFKFFFPEFKSTKFIRR